MRIPSTDGVELQVHELGGEGPDLLLAHATGFHGRVWAPLAAALPEFRCWSVDLRAHGASTRPQDRALEWDGFADDVLAVVDALGLDQPFGVGHSKGGAALALAEQRRPGTFRALFLYEPVIMPPAAQTEEPSHENPLSTGARRRRTTFESHDDAQRNFAGKPPFSALHPEALHAYVRHGFAEQADGTVALRCRPEDEAEVYAMGSVHRAHQGLDRVTCPTTVAAGDLSTPGPAHLGAGIVAALPAGRLEPMPQLGHFGPLEDPAAVAAAVRRTFREREAAGGSLSRG